MAVGQVQTVFKISVEDILAVNSYGKLEFIDVNTCTRKAKKSSIGLDNHAIVQLSKRELIAIAKEQYQNK